jgi:hypothetical protein
VLVLAGTAPLLRWRAFNRERAIRRLRLPVLAAALVVVGTAAAGLRDLYGWPASARPRWCWSAGQEIVSGLAVGRRHVACCARWPAAAARTPG